MKKGILGHPIYSRPLRRVCIALTLVPLIVIHFYFCLYYGIQSFLEVTFEISVTMYVRLKDAWMWEKKNRYFQK